MVTAGPLRFHCWQIGEGDRLALLLHGFPDDAGSMLGLARALADAGYVAIAPNLRGYGATDLAPDGDYDVGALARDVVALVRGLGYSRAALVGHDWGAVASYAAVAIAPELFPRVVTMAIPPLPCFLRALTTSAQLRRSWYMGYLQLPGAAARVRADDFAFIERLWRDWSPGWRAPPERLSSVKRTLRHPGTLEAALAYYRQTRPGPRGLRYYVRTLRELLRPISSNTLILAGVRDGCVGVEAFARAREFVDGPCRVELIADAGHFLHLERPELVRALVTEHLTRA
ncbi:MAG: alpha/beta hydrolase [Myxococcales bacterium]|nr:alpha/beta hydrolase [Myxococcales bacterium]MCB9751085.1 alpha/beta hydrolase [Myxococcales bacterium]